MYPDPFYNTGGAQYPSMWMQMPPGFSPLSAPGPADCPGGDCGASPQDYPFPGFGPPPPPNFSEFYPWQ